MGLSGCLVRLSGAAGIPEEDGVPDRPNAAALPVNTADINPGGQPGETARLLASVSHMIISTRAAEPRQPNCPGRSCKQRHDLPGALAVERDFVSTGHSDD
jgi:hypothetical protein